MSERKFHSQQDCLLSSSRFQVFVSSSGTILSSTEAAAKLLSFTPTESLENKDTNRPCPSAEEVENILNGTKSSAEEKSQEQDLNLGKENATMTSGVDAPPLAGQPFQSYFPDYEEKEGIIQPSELVNPSLPNSSKWIYTCSHSFEQDDKSITKVVYLQDVNELKEEYNSLLRNPVALDSVKKKISLETPDFILESQFEYGETMIMRISSSGSILQLFPLLEPSFLHGEKKEIQNSFIMAFIHPSDEIILHQCLSECLKNGSCHFVLRWAPRLSSSNPSDASHWVQMKATRSTNQSIIVGVSQLKDPLADKKSEGVEAVAAQMVSSAWSYFTSSVTEMKNQGAASGLTSFFAVSRSETKSASDVSGNDPKILKTEQF